MVAARPPADYQARPQRGNSAGCLAEYLDLDLGQGLPNAWLENRHPECEGAVDRARVALRCPGS